ncbi:hypothetical protein HYT92_02320 [Candidatus Pacearchaeota archaeon]|nr:hypothetical protein [Candidatus Pacearchaeota archaeon]
MERLKKYKAARRKGAEGRRGAAHIEMILSFVLFISFLLFILVFINPQKKVEPSKALLDIVSYEIQKNSSVDATTISFELNGVSEECFQVSLEQLGIAGIIGNNKTIIRDSEEGIISSAKGAGTMNIKNSGVFYRIFSSEVFIETSAPACATLATPQPEDIALGQIRAEKAVFFNRALSLNSTYWSDYEALKERFDFPKNSDFSFSIRNIDKGVLINALREKPKSAVVISRDETIKILYENSTSINAVLNIQAW